MYKVEIIKIEFEEGKSKPKSILTKSFANYQKAINHAVEFNKHIPTFIDGSYMLALKPEAEYEFSLTNVFLEAFYTLKEELGKLNILKLKPSYLEDTLEDEV